MRHRAALHLHRQGVKEMMNARAGCAVVYKLVARGNNAFMNGQIRLFRRRHKARAERFVAGQLDEVHLADHAHRVAQGGRVRVVLHGGSRRHEVADAHAVRACARDTQIQHPIRRKRRNHLLCANRRVHLARPADGKHGILPEQLAADERIHANRRFPAPFELLFERLHLNRHGANQTNHPCNPPDSSE